MPIFIRLITEALPEHPRGGPSIGLVCPHHVLLAGEATELRGSWMPAQRVWLFPAEETENVKHMAERLYGTSDSDTELTTNITVRFNTTLEETREGIYGLGRMLVRAKYRDSGVRFGPGVTYRSGPEPTSGGSLKYWKTIIPDGCTLNVRAVPADMARWIAENITELLTVEIQDDQR